MTTADAHSNRYVIHLPVTAPDLPGALNLARVLARSVSFLPQIDSTGAEVSEEDNQNARHQVFCDRPTEGERRRCGKAAAHSGECR
ncbi:hypothetical protein [Micromonospora sp. NPDC004704]